jgi:hypothetical protein
MSDQELSEQIDDRTLHAEKVTAEILEKRLRELDQQLRDMTARAHGAEAACKLKDLWYAEMERRYWTEVYSHASHRMSYLNAEIDRLGKVSRGE